MISAKNASLLALSIILIGAEAMAEDANFGQFTLTPAHKTTVSGSTDGSYDLSSIAQTDQNGNPCIGYASVNPDHMMILKEDLAQLKLEVDSNGQDTTLVVKGPDNILRCDFGTNDTPDAVIKATDWPSGEYKIWVGSIEPSQKWDYRLLAGGK
ncbi:MAG: hypothetical protein GDA44_04280 [Prochloron sp. SP5CPC1]|nr:hypothetical protein [Candidatus Paraprochloron terpiosi SP5CPC1]